MSIVLLVGPSGSGKTTVGRRLEELGVLPLISFTTRKMREGEVDGVDYHFISEEEVGNIETAEITTYSGNTYGLSKEEVANKLSKGNDVYFVANVDGAQQIADTYPDETVCFWLNIDAHTMEERMRARGDSDRAILDRLKHAIETHEFIKPNIRGAKVVEIDATEPVEKIVGCILRKMK